jgi:hypothetical protein
LEAIVGLVSRTRGKALLSVPPVAATIMYEDRLKWANQANACYHRQRHHHPILRILKLKVSDTANTTMMNSRTGHGVAPSDGYTLSTPPRIRLSLVSFCTNSIWTGKIDDHFRSSTRVPERFASTFRECTGAHTCKSYGVVFHSVEMEGLLMDT